MSATGTDRDRGGAPSLGGPGFALYVEGPRDREILQGWARRFSRSASHSLAQLAVILGGRQPDRAIAHFRKLRRAQPDAAGICVLDRDGLEAEVAPEEPGLRFFTWGRRHIESYLLVPAAIRRSLRLGEADPRVERFFQHELPDPEDEHALAQLDAKRLLGRNGHLEELLSARILPGRIARAMQIEEFHPEIIHLFEWLQEPLGIRVGSPEVLSKALKHGRSESPGDIL